MRPSTCSSSLPRRARLNFEVCRTSSPLGFVAGFGSSHGRGSAVKGSTDIFSSVQTSDFCITKCNRSQLLLRRWEGASRDETERPSGEPGGLWSSNGAAIAVTLRCRFRSQLSVGRFIHFRTAWFVVSSGIRPTRCYRCHLQDDPPALSILLADRLLPILILRSLSGGAGHCRRSPFKVVADAFNSSAACRRSCLARSA